MSLQYYDLTLTQFATQKIGAQGRYIYYYAGTTPLITGGATPAAAGNQAIKVQAGQSGNTILLMPGQSYRLDDADKAPTEWIVSNFKQNETITGQILVGEGDFQDSNTSNTSYVKLDASFANNVAVTNTTANRIPVSLDANQTLNVAGNIVAYSYPYTSSNASTSNVAIQMLPAVTNVNGAVLNKFDLLSSAGAAGAFAVVAKATAPANIADGDVLFASFMAAGSLKYSLDLSKDGQIKVPAGKAVWYINNQADNASLRDALFTVL